MKLRFNPVIIILIVIVISGLGYYFLQKDPSQSSNTKEEQWGTEEVAIAGTYADPDIVDLGNGKFRMYFGIEPEVSGNNLEVYSAISTDGKMWTQESGARKTRIAFPDVVKLSDGAWRMYFQDPSGIKSALSADGLTWNDESGVRIDTLNETGFSFKTVSAPTTLKLKDGSFLMVYSGRTDEQYNDQVPNKDISIFMWATSKNGLDWEKKGVAVDTRNTTLEGFADGPDLIEWSENNIRLYFWGYKGVYYSTFENGMFTEPKLTFKASNASNLMYPSNPPSDPTLIKIGSTWYMYYGYYTKGIYYSTLQE